MAYCVGRSGDLAFILTGGSVASGADCSRFYYGSPIREVDWSNTQIGLITAKQGVGNRWVLRHCLLWPVKTDVYSRADGYLTGLKIGTGATFTNSGFTYLNSNGAPFGISIGEAYTSTLHCGANGSVFFKNYDGAGTGHTTNETSYNSANPLHLGGESCTFIATPKNANYRVKRWTVNDSQVAGIGQDSVTVLMPSGAATIYCEFEQYKFPVTVKSGSNSAIGTISKTITSSYYEVDKLVGEFTATATDSENYKFSGWYKAYLDNATAEQCNILVTTNATFTITAENSPVTYCAKFVSRKTTLKVDVASAKEDGVGTFDITVNDDETLTQQTSFINDDARDGWRVVLTAKPYNDYSYFDHWLIPFGNAATQDVYEPTLSMDLLAREENAFTAYFSGKTKKTIGVEIDGIGEVSYDSFDGNGSTSEAASFEVYEESEVVFTATKSNKLYAFECWEYAIGSTWAKLTNETKPTWIRSVNVEQVVVFFPNTWTTTSNLRAVFRKLNTYTIATPFVSGEHPINKTLANSPDSGCSVSGLPAPDEVVDGVEKWLEDTVFVITATQGPKWQFAQLTIVQPDETIKETESQSVTVTLKGNISKIEAAFSAKKYPVTPKVEADSVDVGKVKMTYKDISNEDVTTDSTAMVYVDTPVKIEAYTEATGGSVAFHAWSLNNVATNYGATANVTIVGSSEFVATFKVKQSFVFEGYTSENETTYALGGISIDYFEDGYLKQEVLPQEKINSKDLMLVCGSTYTLTATANSVTTESGAKLQGYFNGWQQQNSDATWSPVDGWGEVVEAIKVSTPRTLKAVFSEENRWPILRLRNIGDTSYASFSVGGARPDRIQKVNESVSVVLTNANDYFCDPYSIVQVRLDKYYEGSKFVKWEQYEFGSVDEPGTKLIGDYSTTQDLSIFMTGNLYLVPVFYTGNPIPATALLSPKVDATWGDVSIEGEALEEDSDSKKSFAQGDTATFVASPRNGYRFVGWSTTGYDDAIESVSARYEVTMDYAKTYYAIFEQDRNAVYRFGESEETRMMTWHSKRVVVNTPTDFSVAQVDAEGYGEDGPMLSVLKASSPDVPAKGKTYIIKNANSRRLVMGGRGEKCFEFVVESAVPVNRVAISTSVTGLMGGA